MMFAKTERKWQNLWDKKSVFAVKENPKKKKYYVLEMFPYPSASFLHMGHVRNYSIGDVIARYKRMNGFNVLYPVGYDSFGLPAENAAKKEGMHPKKYTENAIKKIIKYQKQLGLSYDWTRVIATHRPEYYRWNQYFFIKLLENGLAYKKKSPVNFCPNCQTVLANEEVEQGKCWRCNSDVEIKQLKQWFLKITAYADELLKGLDALQWPEQLKEMQRNWIGKSKGSSVKFRLQDKSLIEVFTTRPDTLFGVTFLTIAPEHPKTLELAKFPKHKIQVEAFVKKTLSQSNAERTNQFAEKEGVFTGSYAFHPLTNEKIPVYTANFVLPEYGTGIVMGVPAHDQRDYDFAKKYNIQIKQVIQPKQKIEQDRAYEGEGILINSGKFNGMESNEAISKITKELEEKKAGCFTTQYKIKDWCISRQRYWGTPIPVIYCEKCGIVPVPENQLPVLLPEDVSFSGTGNPLLTSKKFKNAKCPKCKSKARRETDTMGGFMDSSWYFLRYCDSKNSKKPFDAKKAGYWMPVDQYIGGIEHAVGHLIYARFFTKALRDMKLLGISEPFARLFNQGIVYKDSHKMSKSFGNIVTQDEMSKKYGIDTTRLFLLSVALPEKSIEWTNTGIEGMFRFANRIIALFENKPLKSRTVQKENPKTTNKLNICIKSVTEHIENFRFNLAIIHLMEFVNYASGKSLAKQTLETFLKLLSPFAPHIAEELNEKLGNKPFISIAKWPKPGKINQALEQQDKIFESLKSDISNILRLVREKQNLQPKKAFIYTIPKDKNVFEQAKAGLESSFNLAFQIFAVNDKSIYDPKNKAKKAKPSRPAIYLE